MWIYQSFFQSDNPDDFIIVNCKISIIIIPADRLCHGTFFLQIPIFCIRTINKNVFSVMLAIYSLYSLFSGVIVQRSRFKIFVDSNSVFINKIFPFLCFLILSYSRVIYPHTGIWSDIYIPYFAPSSILYDSFISQSASVNI